MKAYLTGGINIKLQLKQNKQCQTTNFNADKTLSEGTETSISADMYKHGSECSPGTAWFVDTLCWTWQIISTDSCSMKLNTI